MLPVVYEIHRHNQAVEHSDDWHAQILSENEDGSSSFQRNIFPARVDTRQTIEGIGYGFHIGVGILRQMIDLPHMHGLLLSVHFCHHNGNTRALGNMIIAALPLRHMMTRAFGGNGEDEVGGLVARLHHLLYKPAGLFPIHRHAAAKIEEPAIRRTEQLRFAHEADVRPESKDDAEEQQEVPIRGVRRADQNELRQGGQFPVHAPTGDAHPKTGGVMKENAEDGRVENRHTQIVHCYV